MRSGLASGRPTLRRRLGRMGHRRAPFSGAGPTPVVWPRAGSTHSRCRRPPTQTVEVKPAPVTINLDGQKAGEGLINFIVSGGKGPIGGGPYFDPSTGAVPFDLIHR
jgi:hypothetical protein